VGGLCWGVVLFWFLKNHPPPPPPPAAAWGTRISSRRNLRDVYLC
jgi:hypothetical protein